MIILKNKFIRVKIRKGMYVVMDGPSRMEWAHGLPSNVPYKKLNIVYYLNLINLMKVNVNIIKH